MTKKVQNSEKSSNLLSTNIDSFRNYNDLTIKDFCRLSHISLPQYSEYKTGRNRFLSITDAVKLLAAFPGKLTVNKLLKMTGEQPLLIGKEFPKIIFSENKKTDREETETVFINFITYTAYDLFTPIDANKILSPFLQPCNDDELFLPMKNTMICLMSNLMRIRKKKYSDFNSPRRTVISHFQRSFLPVRFSDICGYERLFRSGGIYLLSEIMYLNERNKIGIRLSQKNNM